MILLAVVLFRRGKSVHSFWQVKNSVTVSLYCVTLHCVIIGILRNEDVTPKYVFTLFETWKNPYARNCIFNEPKTLISARCTPRIAILRSRFSKKTSPAHEYFHFEKFIWLLYSASNDPIPEMIPISDRKWSRTANDPRRGPQMIPAGK